MNATIPVVQVKREDFPCLVSQVPQGLLPFSVLGKKVFWDVFLTNAEGTTFRISRADIEAALGPCILHLVSDSANADLKRIGRFGVGNLGTWSDEPNDLFSFYELGGGGSGAIHYTISEGTLLIGLQPAKRNRKGKLKGLEAPRGYDDAAKLIEGIAARLKQARETAEVESSEEATVFTSMIAHPITWADGTIVGTDTNGSVLVSQVNQGFKYSAIEWPAELLRAYNQQGVLEPDYSNPVVTPSTGDASAGHTGQMYFLPLPALFDKSYLPQEWDDGVAVDGLGMTGILALQEMLRREGRIK